ncbi:longitudinals lacking protein, isoforms N/O/W/X/Y-like [Odontomachus brunneus]|uniref:longitudinals lacking protein, isoforms N/O/W/X/Y-like n=1 Tax=Odontomachus brunneus TaxID=486640 RepID=UPI0013F18B9C|nr:longitudinals lacking protein, isoforms N/O/W/X/Y-like [Odontomachus brunneus]
MEWQGFSHLREAMRASPANPSMTHYNAHQQVPVQLHRFTTPMCHTYNHVNFTQRALACSNCPRTYSTMRALRFHETTECNQNPKFICDFCTYRSLRRANLRRHMLRRHKRDML